MSPSKLKSRLKFKKKRDTPISSEPVKAIRRGSNYIEMEEDSSKEEYEDFFEYENELSNLESARSQSLKSDDYNDFINGIGDDIESHNYVEMEESKEDDVISPIIMEIEISDIENNSKRKYNDVVGFNFIYCAFIKKNGEQCKRQAPKGKEYCATHHRMIGNS